MNAPIALITGGGSGIGLAVAEHLINHYGYRVGILDIDKARVDEQSARLGSHNCLGVHADVTDYDQQAQAFVQTFEWGGNRLDLFFANAGIGDQDSLYKDLAMDERTGLPKPLNLRTINVNLDAVIQGVHLARHFFSEKNTRKGGRIVATASVIGLYPNHALPLYTASKHGVVGLVRACAPVYLKDNITINAILPTLIETNLMPKHVAANMHIPEQMTPMSTALKAFDALLRNVKLTGQIMELALQDVVFKQQPEYSRANTKWMFEQMTLWETACEPLMPRKPGDNAVQIKPPATLSMSRVAA